MRNLGLFLFLGVISPVFLPVNAQLFVTGIDGVGTREVGHVHFFVETISINNTGDELLLGGMAVSGDHRVYSISSTGGNLKRLSPNSAPSSSGPVFAPDQIHIVFTEFVTSAQITVVDKAWANKKMLTNGASPSFSLDGSLLAFERTGGGPNYFSAIFVSNADGSNEHQITPPNALTITPTFDPQDSHIIVFAEWGVGIVATNSDGTGRRVILNDPNAFEPTFTPDGKQIVYAFTPTAGPNEKFDLYIMNSDGSNRRKLTNEPKMWCRNPVVSPDGTQIYFHEIPKTHIEEYEKNWRALHHLPNK
jgi:Tol biopolymer transport system component